MFKTFVVVLILVSMPVLAFFLPNIREVVQERLPKPEMTEEPYVEPVEEAEEEMLLPPLETLDLVEEDGVTGVKFVRRLPDTLDQVARAHRNAVGMECEPLPAGEPLHLTGFRAHLTSHDARLQQDEIKAPASRRHLFSIGLDMLRVDQQELPTLSSRQILSYLNSHFISLQARIQKDPITNEQYLHHRPIAAMGAFHKRGVTQATTDGLAASLRNYRSIGVFLKDGQEATPENLRTLVLVHKVSRDTGASRPETRYEFVFVRGVKSSASTELRFHTFVTTDNRTVLRMLEPCDRPTRAESCSASTLLRFTDYRDAGLRPVASLTRGTTFRGASTYTMESLNAYGEVQGWRGDALDNLSATLDAIIGGNIPVSRLPISD